MSDQEKLERTARRAENHVLSAKAMRSGADATEVGGQDQGSGSAERLLPAVIPEELLEREAEHVEGFSPELAVVTPRAAARSDRVTAIQSDK